MYIKRVFCQSPIISSMVRYYRQKKVPKSSTDDLLEAVKFVEENKTRITSVAAAKPLGILCYILYDHFQ